ncbi:chromate transporter [Mycoplasmopsis sturni]|uniref:chromate transporter n=1 Tax=Mycoplasmopsis sturni TaxID=39047 RepID=UPI00056277AA|nr:chromate transporter [Mycoplasmopsis sturni]
MLILVSFVLLIIISLSVFGGGQLFMPVFEWFWGFIKTTFNFDITSDDIAKFFAVGNSTPGILAPKFAIFTGYALGEGHWWVILTTLGAYIIFAAPAILLMLFSKKIVNKYKDTLFLKSFFRFMSPILVGILGALVVTLFLKLVFPSLGFNNHFGEYIKINSDSEIARFFSGWRLILLLVYVPIGIVFFIYLIVKKIPLVYLILGNISVGLIILLPWM